MDIFANLSLPSLTLAQLLYRLVAVVVVIGVYGWAVAYLADRLGDPGPRYDGRRTLNPLTHLDVIGLVFGLFFRVTWIPRVDVDVTKVRGRVGGAVIVAVGASALLAFVSLTALFVRPWLLSLLPNDAALLASALLNTTADIAIVTALVQLLPFPPFVGALLLSSADRWKAVWNGPTARWIGVVVVVLAGLSGWLPRLVSVVTRSWRSLLGF